MFGGERNLGPSPPLTEFSVDKYKEIFDKRNRIESLINEKENFKIELYKLEEAVRNLKGKIGCPNCESVFEKTSDLTFCSKCGSKLEQMNND